MENKEVKLSRRERRVNEEIQQKMESLSTRFYQARALKGDNQAAEVLDSLDHQWRSFVTKMKRKGYNLSSDQLLTDISSTIEIEDTTRPIYDKTVQKMGFNRWKKQIELNHPRRAWIYALLDKIVKVFNKDKTYWKRRYEKIRG